LFTPLVLIHAGMQGLLTSPARLAAAAAAGIPATVPPNLLRFDILRRFDRQAHFLHSHTAA
jgi:hypothetical protein